MENMNNYEQAHEILKKVLECANTMKKCIIVTEEQTKKVLPQIVKFNKKFLCNNHADKKILAIYKEIYQILFPHLNFIPFHEEVKVSLKSDSFFNDNHLLEDLKEIVEKVTEFRFLLSILQTIENQRKKFFEQKCKMNELFNENRIDEIDYIFDEIETLNFNDSCSIYEFINLIEEEMCQY